MKLDDIIFRGQDVKGKWWRGTPVRETNKEKDKWRICIDKYDRMQAEVKPETIGQYTGSQDSDDKKIFEGDIVKITKNKTVIYNKEVKWDNEKKALGINYYMFGKIFVLTLDLITSFDSVEIIGNIFDNPELLEEETK